MYKQTDLSTVESFTNSPYLIKTKNNYILYTSDVIIEIFFLTDHLSVPEAYSDLLSLYDLTTIQKMTAALVKTPVHSYVKQWHGHFGAS